MSRNADAVRRASGTSLAGAMSPAIRHAWFMSTMMSMESPTASRVARTAAKPSSIWRRSIRILRALKPCARNAKADSARAAGAFSSPHEAYARRRFVLLPNKNDTG